MKNYVLLLAIFITLSGCASYSGDHFASYDSEVSGRIIYSKAFVNERIDGKMFQSEPGLLFRSTWNKPAKTNYRWVQTFTRTGPYHYSGMHLPAFAVICDGVPTVEMDDIVAVRFLKVKYDYDYDQGRAEEVLKLICKHSDKSCIDALKASNKWGTTTGINVPSSVVPPDMECRRLIRPKLTAN